jgi:predicted aspartyl protease
MWKLFAAAALLLAISVPAAADTQCRLVRIATVDMAVEDGGRPTVPLKVGDKTLTMLIDTGGIMTTISEGMANSLGLHRQRIADDMQLLMVGGTRLDHFVVAPQIEFGGLNAQNFPFVVMPDDGANMDGTIGPDILTQYDADFDFANARFNLFSRDHCPGQVVYWTKDPYADIDIIIQRGGHIKVPVTLDGHRLTALLDTGSWRSALSLETAKNVFSLKDADLKPLEHTSNKASRVHPFTNLSIQGITVNNPDIVLLPDAYAHLGDFDSPDMLLGIGILRQMHLYISYRERKLYVTPAAAH